jgi:hypothetical protein
MTTSDRLRRAAICQWVFAPAFRIEQITLALKPNVRWSEKHLDEKRPNRGFGFAGTETTRGTTDIAA